MTKRLEKIVVFGGLTLAIGASAVLGLPHHVGPDYLYPNPALTPGVVATQDFIELTAINPTYSQAHRLTTDTQKKQVCAEYPTNCAAGQHEIDHFCPLALGCADDVRNLWAQPASNMWNGQDFGFHAKDRLETLLVLKMKAGAISPADAQDCILNDWVACYQKYLGSEPTFGTVDSGVDPDTDEVQ